MAELASERVRELQLSGRVGPELDGRYLPWDAVRRRQPPHGLSAREWWLLIALARQPLKRELPLIDTAGRPFRFATPDSVQRLLHRIDSDARGNIGVDEPVANPAMRDRYVVSSLIEEAVTSSQLEGASTTRRVAKELLRSGRRAVTRDEQMVVNNFYAMEFIHERRGDPLSPALIVELQRILTVDTLDDPDCAGRLREPDERVHVIDRDDEILHVPPDARQLPDRLDYLCRFANGELEPPGVFVHPVVRAIVTHFWLAYDHPFVDGNGRTARALFYWSMLSQGYWVTEFLSISRILRRAPARYTRSFLDTETCDNDVTYFIVDQLRVIGESIDALQAYLARKMRETRDIERRLRNAADLNHRQLALLSHAARHPGTAYTIESHQRSHRVAYDTARRDLLDLARRRLLVKRRRGKAFVFHPADSFEDRIRSDDRILPSHRRGR